MKNENIYLLNSIIHKNIKEFGLTMVKQERTEKIISILRDNWHFWGRIENPIAEPFSFQATLNVEQSAIRMFIFPSPRIIQANNIESYIRVSNIGNQYLFHMTALGRFWVDVNHLDFVYEVILKEDLIEHCPEEVSKQLFAIPLAHLKDLHIPLVMISQRGWSIEKATKYLVELREKGFVNNYEYNLW